MTEQPERKLRKAVTKETVKSIRKSLLKELKLKEIAEEAEFSISCARSVCAKISAGISDEDIVGSKKGRRGYGSEGCG